MARTRGLGALATILERHRGGVADCISHGRLINAVTYPVELSQAPDDLWFLPWHTGITARGGRQGRILVSVNTPLTSTSARTP